MAPRKRKAGPQLQPIAEAGPSPAQCNVPNSKAPQHPPELRCANESSQTAQTVQGCPKSAALESAVRQSVNAMLLEAHEVVTTLRQEMHVALLRIPKKLRELTVAEAFQLNMSDPRATTMSGLLEMLSALAGGGPMEQPAKSPAAECAKQPASTVAEQGTGKAHEVPCQVEQTCARTTRTSCRTAARTAAGRIVAQIAPGTAARKGRRAAIQPTSQVNQQEHSTAAGGGARQQEAVVVDQALPSSAAEVPVRATEPTATLSRAVQQAVGTAVAQDAVTNPGAHDAQCSMDCSVLATPAHGRAPPLATPCMRAAASMATGAAPTGAVSTALPAASSTGVGSVLRGVAGGPGLMAGFTLCKTNVGAPRGRTRGARTQYAPEDPNAIMISTTDGRQFMIDTTSGLAAVPDNYRKEVAAQLELMQRLASAALRLK